MALPLKLIVGSQAVGLSDRTSESGMDKATSTNRTLTRQAETKFTLETVEHVPHLREKLDWLCAYHPRLKRHYEVARELNVQGSTITEWIQGKIYKDQRVRAVLNPECIPIRHFPAFEAIWGLPRKTLKLPDIEAFKTALAAYEAGLGPWTKFVRAIPDCDGIEVILSGSARGVIDPDDLENPGLPTFAVGDFIMFRVANPELRHGALLLQDQLRWRCLRPTSRFLETVVGEEMIFPRQIQDEPARFTELDRIGGLHHAIAIFTQDPFPDGMMDVFLSQTLEGSDLASTVPVLNRLLAEERCRVFGKRFNVI